ncbi:NAD-dependent epimerase/dehydratase family protein [Herbidospora galbida]|uniref:NAD-dependent epimerase/dehydratase family protein n=1 Tax=Herbidospora galbida TaxID=2575442 RepID=A0A4U3LNE0_9ACTN|nr:NAD-dependent epimerase/dehydratase family protein [Herbidospora galbida]TKK77311.1 NAD-dependent epimerase/dehydratase family protein [Herbidospora galbida]
MSTVFVTGGSGFIGAALIPALHTAGHRTVALARSDQAADRVAALGARPVRADLSDQDALTRAMAGCDAVIHAAARMRGGRPAAFHDDNVTGTRNLLAAARSAGTPRFVHVGAAGCLVGGRRPILGADESWTLHRPAYSPYLTTKTISDHDVRRANAPGLTTCVVRPGWVWGDGDPIFEQIVTAAREGKMVLIDGGRHPVVTSHRDNTVSGVLAALDHGQGGEGYYVFDEETTTIGEFLTALLSTRELPRPARSIPYPLARTVANTLEFAHRLLRRPGEPPITRMLVEFNGRPFDVSDRKARAELGYRPLTTRAAGLARMRGVTTRSCSEFGSCG